MVAYASGGSLNPFYSLLSGPKNNFSNDWDIIKLARQGFSKRVLLSLAKKNFLNPPGVNHHPAYI